MTSRPLGTIQELSASLLSPSDFSYDKTDEDLAGNTTFLQSERKCKRPSAPPMEEDDDDITPPGKKHKRSVSRWWNSARIGFEIVWEIGWWFGFLNAVHLL